MEEQFGPLNQYALQGGAFSRAILEDTEVPTPLCDAIANMAVIEASVQSHHLDAWVVISPGRLI